MYITCFECRDYYSWVIGGSPTFNNYPRLRFSQISWNELQNNSRTTTEPVEGEEGTAALSPCGPTRARPRQTTRAAAAAAVADSSAGAAKTTTGTSPTTRLKQATRAAASAVTRDDAAEPAAPPAEVQVPEDGDLEETRTASKPGPRERAAASRVSPWRANTEQNKR